MDIADTLLVNAIPRCAKQLAPKAVEVHGGNVMTAPWLLLNFIIYHNSGFIYKTGKICKKKTIFSSGWMIVM